jgi:hypothetical protein
METRRARQALQYTLRNVAPEVDRALRARARDLGRSLNSVALDALKRGAGVGANYDDLDAFFGSWIEDSAVDRALADQRVVDEELWR